MTFEDNWRLRVCSLSCYLFTAGSYHSKSADPVALQCSTDRRLGKWPDNSVILLGSSQSINNNSVPCGEVRSIGIRHHSLACLHTNPLRIFITNLQILFPCYICPLTWTSYTVMYWELQIFYFAIFMIFSTTPLSLIPAVHISIFHGFKFLQRDL